MAAERIGEVYDLGYQRYDGPREGRWRSRKAMYWNGVKTVLGIGRGAKAKILPILLFNAAMVPAIVFVIILSFVGDAVDPFVGAAGYYEIIAMVLFIFAAIMAPELLSPDRRERVLDLYLVRPISPSDYVGAKVLAFFTIVLALAYSGQVLLQIGLVLTASEPLAYLRENWLDIPRFLVAGVLVAAFITVIPLAVSAFTTRRGYASAAVIGLFMISAAVVNPLTVRDCNVRTVNGEVRFDADCDYVTGDSAKWIALLNVPDTPLRVNDMIFGRDAEDRDAPDAYTEFPEFVPPLALAAYVVGPLGLMWWRYRRSTI